MATDLKEKIIRLALVQGINPEALKCIAKETGYCPQYIRQIVRDCVSLELIEKYAVTDAGIEYLEQGDLL